MVVVQRLIGAEVGSAMGIARKVVADAAITFLWVFTIASLGAVATAIAQRLGLDGPGHGMLYIVFTLVSLHIFFFGFLGQALGGASWNPTSSIAFAYAGVSKDDLFTLAATIPAQMAGAVGGVLAIQELMPKPYKHMLSGPKLKVPVGTGVLAEAALTFTITLIVMWALLRGPSNPIAKTFCIIVGTISLVAAGTPYTGPAMNPANAFGWAFVTNPKYVTSWEHLAVYWAGPLIGTICAVWAFNLLFGSQAGYTKEIDARKSKTSKKTPDGDAAKTKNVETEADADDVAGKVKAS